ncbi:transcription termination factor MTERF9, chloroplastic isoform X1 [Benincasa hispida]|uniref:transcription termination factor MTERF9, chloroplastic isoform X1 n=1 Tax=Benincasa hispida TaxID=102211 RepID=UPI0019017CF4|nr:transcription termination factor MTERF9, chloroplastic isoform X1 [Benincasa hispida]
MVSLSLFSFSPTAHSDFPSSSDLYLSTQFRLSSSTSACNFHGVGIGSRNRRRNVRRFVVRSTHSNARILKPKRKSRFGQTLSPFDSDEDGEDVDEFSSDGDDDDAWLDNGDFSDVEYDAKRKRTRLQSRTKSNNSQRDNLRHPRESRGIRSSNDGNSFEVNTNRLDFQDSTNDTVKQDFTIEEEVCSTNIGRKGKLMTKKAMEIRFPRLAEEIELDEKWFPLLDYLTTFGLKESHFLQMYERHMPSLQINVYSAQERLEYLLSVGVKQRDVRRILLRQPQILEYTVENNLKSHVAFLLSLGIPNSRVGQIIAAAPSLFSYSVENSLKPTVRYLVEEVGIEEKDLGKVVQLSPQILVQRIDISWNTRYMFLSKEIGAPRDNVVKMVTKHPQLLHYSIDDGLRPRINFLRSIGMRNSEILKVLTSLTQVFSLSLEDNLKPKYMYLINELRNEVKSLTKYPMYLSLSLDQRIRPRHRFLVSLKKAPKGPFPLSSLVPTDECFCQQWAETSLDKYLEFRKRLLLKEFAQKYERR